MLAENSDVMVAAVTPAVVKIGQIYSVPYAQSVEQKNDKPGNSQIIIVAQPCTNISMKKTNAIHIVSEFRSVKT